jgi:LEA14-like dessication related protein
MKKLALAFVVVLIIVVGAAAGLYFGGFLKPPDLQAVRMSWGEVTAQETEVKGEIRINNRLPVGLGSSNVGVEVPVEFYEVPAFSLTLPELLLEKGESTLGANGALRQAELPRWWPQFVNNGEVLAIRVRPKIWARLLGRQLGTQLPGIETEASIPLLRGVRSGEARTMGFDDASPVELAGDPGKHFVVGPPRPPHPVLTVESWEFHWGAVSQATTQLLGTIVLNNETVLPLPIQGLGLGIDMNKIRVVPDVRVTPGLPYLPPGQSVPLKLDAQVDNAKLVEWWTSHLQQGEETIVTVRIAVTIVLPRDLPGGLGNNVELPLVPVPGFHCIINTDIMGVVNYEIAKAIGTAAGEQPKAASVDCPAPPTPTLGGLTGITPGATPPLPTGAPTLPAPPSLPPGAPILIPPQVLTPTPNPSPVHAPVATPTATPVPTYSLNVSVALPGGGIVALLPPGGTYRAGTAVLLTAIPAPGHFFDHWSGDGSGTSPTATPRMDADKSVLAHFRRVLP